MLEKVLDKEGLTYYDTKSKKYVQDEIAKTKKYCIVGSNTANTSGWYKVASQTMFGYDDTNVTFMITSMYKDYFSGILQLQMRSDNTFISCKALKWHSRIGFDVGDVICVIDDMTFTLYVHRSVSQYGRILFEVISESNITSASTNITLHNSTSPETTEPVATVIATDGATVCSANQVNQIYLSTEDVDDIKPDNLTWYYTGGSTAVVNNPFGDGKAFAMCAYRAATGYRTQEAISYSGIKKVRYYNGTDWSDWRTLAYGDEYLPLTGGTLTGDIGIPIGKSSINGSVPYAGSNMTDISSISSISDYKTYLGTYTDSNATWYNIISIRHRNGYEDGSNYGMYLRSGLTFTGNLTWGKQYGSTSWQAERTILDSSNYTSYCTPANIGAATSSHTHSYAGSSSAGGAATTALACTGNAATATNVAWSGVTSKPSYYDAKAIKGITRSGTTFTYTCMDGTTGTFTQQDNNTTYSVVSTTADGLAPKRDGSTTKYLRADGTWAVPPDTNTTYTSLKNPYALTIQGNGTTLTNGTYDGSAAKTVNITPSSIGAAASSHTHSQSDITSYVHSATGINGTPGYVKIATLKVLTNYQNEPLVIELTRRSAETTCTLYIAFAPEDSADPALGQFKYIGTNYNCYMYKSATSTWDLYVQKSEAWDDIGVLRYHKPSYMSGVSITWTNVLVTTPPTGSTVATIGGSVASASTATKLATARTISLTGSVTGSGSFDGSGNLSIATTTNHTHSYLPLSGGTLTGTVSSTGNISGKWLQSTADNASSNKLSKICVQDDSGWVYTRTLEQFATDIEDSLKTEQVIVPIQNAITNTFYQNKTKSAVKVEIHISGEFLRSQTKGAFTNIIRISSNGCSVAVANALNPADILYSSVDYKGGVTDYDIILGATNSISYRTCSWKSQNATDGTIENGTVTFFTYVGSNSWLSVQHSTDYKVTISKA